MVTTSRSWWHSLAQCYSLPRMAGTNDGQQGVSVANGAVQGNQEELHQIIKAGIMRVPLTQTTVMYQQCQDEK